MNFEAAERCPDVMDQSAMITDLYTDISLVAHQRAMQAMQDQPVYTRCQAELCGEKIPLKRRGHGVRYCIDCQRLRELGKI